MQKIGANNWTRTSDLFHVKEARYQLRYIRTCGMKK